MRKYYKRLLGFMVAAMTLALCLFASDGWCTGTPRGFTVDFSNAVFSSVSGNALRIQTTGVAVSLANSSGQANYTVVWSFSYTDNNFHIVSFTNSTTGSTSSTGGNISTTPGRFTVDFSNAVFSSVPGNALRIQTAGVAVSGQTNYIVLWEFSYVDNNFHISSATAGDAWTLAKLPDTGQTRTLANYMDDGDYTINPPSYTDNGNGTVTDNVTSLVWQQQDDDVGRTWDEAKSYCGSLELAGYTDWRLPNITEIGSIINYGTYNPGIDSTYFPNTKSNDPNIDTDFWSTTPWVGDDTKVWVAGFGNANTFFMGIGWDLKSDNTNYTRCVRGGTAFSGKVFTDNGNGTVTDNRTRLMWQQGEGGNAYYRDVQLNYCEDLTLAGYTDWRLPNFRELNSIKDYGKSTEPWIDTEYFPNAHADVYATSTDVPSRSDMYLLVYFGSARNPCFLRCIRGDGQ
jgi:hypothetical protein